MMTKQALEKKEAFLRDMLENQQIDILFECLVGLIVRAEGLDADDFHVIPMDNHRRSFKNDVIPVPREDEFDPIRHFTIIAEKYITLFTSRSAIIDYLPEDLYTDADNTNEFWDEDGERKTHEETEKYKALKRKQLESANKFFRPLEVAYNRVRIWKELQAVGQLENFDNLLELFWGIETNGDKYWKRFVRTLHLVQHIVGKPEKTKVLIEYVLGVKVSLSFHIEESCGLSPKAHTALMGEELVLGVNMNLGNVVYDYLNVCTLCLEDISTEAFFEYFDEQNSKRKLLDEMVKYYFPLDVEVRFDFKIKKAEKNESEERPPMVLGYSSVLL